MLPSSRSSTSAARCVRKAWAPGSVPRKDDSLVGGLYGVTLGSGFFGESMFSLIPSASKIALIMLARLMKQLGNSLIDCQFETPHLKTMGGRYIDYDEYLKLIRQKNPE